MFYFTLDMNCINIHLLHRVTDVTLLCHLTDIVCACMSVERQR